jgi:hypothetical protein
MITRRTMLVALLAATDSTNALALTQPPRLRLAFGPDGLGGLDIYVGSEVFSFEPEEIARILRDK